VVPVGGSGVGRRVVKRAASSLCRCRFRFGFSRSFSLFYLPSTKKVALVSDFTKLKKIIEVLFMHFWDLKKFLFMIKYTEVI